MLFRDPEQNYIPRTASCRGQLFVAKKCRRRSAEKGCAPQCRDFMATGLQAGPNLYFLSMNSPITSPIIFQGSKFFWRTQTTIDVTIVQHKCKNITEVVAYEPSLDQESPRIYLNSTVLCSVLDQDAITAKLSLAKQNNVSHNSTFLRNTYIAVTVDYILKHLTVTEYSVDSFTVEVQLSCQGVDNEAGCDRISKLICSAPEDLVPHVAKHFKRVTQAEIKAAFVALNDEQRAANKFCIKAEALQVQTASVLTAKERWRIPLVLVKVVKKSPLSEADTQIWYVVAKNLKINDVRTAVSSSKPITSRATALPTSSYVVPARNRAGTAHLQVSHSPRGPGAPHSSLSPRNSHCLLASTESSQSRLHVDKSIAKPSKPRKLSVPSRVSSDDLFGTRKTQPASILTQLAAGLATLAAALSGAHNAPKIHAVESDEGEETETSAHFSVRGSVKSLNTHASTAASAPPSVCAVDISEQRCQLAALQPHLLGTLSTAPSLMDDQDFLMDEDYTTNLSEHEVALPRRRRSYFSALSAPFSRADSSDRYMYMNKNGGHIFFGDVIAHWLNWNTHTQVAPDVKESIISIEN